MPLLMPAMMVMPALIMAFSDGDDKTVLVVDQSQTVGQSLTDEGPIKFAQAPADVDWRAELRDGKAEAVLVIPPSIENSGETSVELYTDGPSSLTLESEIRGQVSDIIENHKLGQYDIQNLREIIDQVKTDVTVRNINVTDDEDKESSTILSYMLGIVLTMLLYMCLLLYGQMVMTSIIEEKGNRVLELVVSSVKPMQLMLGKICGIGLVAVTQILIWTVLIAAMSAFLLPAMLPADVMADMATYNANPAANVSTDVDMLQALSLMGNVGYILQLFGLLLLFLVGGFMLYAAIYAAIGSAVDNIQDASQLQSVVIFPIIFGIVFGMMAASDPTSSLSFWTSMIPFTSPMVMMARIPFGIPTWEIVLSLAILYLSFFAMVWVAGKIYRVGIFMYGKKPTVRELIRWINYK